MHGKIEPLLCELHAHTTWSDGELSLRELVDLYGRSGFDVLCVTDHSVRSDDPWLAADAPQRSVHAGNHSAYLSEIEAEAARARHEYDLLLVPGLELTYNDLDPYLAAHAVALGCRAFVSVDRGVDAALARARRGGGAHCRPSVSHPAPELARPGDAALLPGLAHAGPARRPLGALQPLRPVRLGRGAGPAGNRERRLSPAGAPLRLEDAAAVREERGSGRSLPALPPSSVPHADRRSRRAARRCVTAPSAAPPAACAGGSPTTLRPRPRRLGRRPVTSRCRSGHGEQRVTVR